MQPGWLAVTLVAVTVATMACRGDKIATARLTGPGTADVKFNATGGSLALWADVEAKWRAARTRGRRSPTTST